MNTTKFKKLVEGLLKEEDPPVAPTPAQPENKNVVDSIPKMQKFLKQLAIDLPTIKGIDINEVKKLVALLETWKSKVSKGSIATAIDAATNLVTKRTQGLK